MPWRKCLTVPAHDAGPELILSTGQLDSELAVPCDSEDRGHRDGHGRALVAGRRRGQAASCDSVTVTVSGHGDSCAAERSASRGLSDRSPSLW